MPVVIVTPLTDHPLEATVDAHVSRALDCTATYMDRQKSVSYLKGLAKPDPESKLSKYLLALVAKCQNALTEPSLTPPSPNSTPARATEGESADLTNATAQGMLPEVEGAASP